MAYVLIYKDKDYEAAMLQAETLEQLNAEILEEIKADRLDMDTWEDTGQTLFHVEANRLTELHNWRSVQLPQIQLF
jgi:hypothetical protein